MGFEPYNRPSYHLSYLFLTTLWHCDKSLCYLSLYTGASYRVRFRNDNNEVSRSYI